ncbi:MAG: M23 family metallopeptidase [Ruminococcus sp.]|nr:M23 family metallopeptidase [Ruminococcus sp.]
MFSDNSKGSKGFYAALGISAIMIGSACYFAYDQGEKLTEELTAQNSSSESESDAAVDKKIDNIPKTTDAAYQPVTQTTARTFAETAPLAETVPPIITTAVVEIVEDYYEQPVDAEIEQETLYVGASKMENVIAPLADMDNVLAMFSGGELVKSITTGSWQTHNGIDIAAEVGSEVYAISNGEIMEINNDPVWGVTVLLDHHNGYVTRYCGLSDGLEVQLGDMMVSGDLIGTVGNTADIESALSPHLHMEILHNGNYIDPLSELNK